MRQAIITRYIGATNRRGARIMARCAAKTIFVPYRHVTDEQDNHRMAVRELLKRLNWDGDWSCGQLPNGDRVWVMDMAPPWENYPRSIILNESE